jgi:hypothetical protein
MMMVDVTGQQPVNPPAQITGFFRLQDRMEMIRHEAIGENFHRMDLLGLGHQFNEELIVLFRPENFLPTVPAVEYVVYKLARQSPSDPGQTLLPLEKFPVPIFDELKERTKIRWHCEVSSISRNPPPGPPLKKGGWGDFWLACA